MYKLDKFEFKNRPWLFMLMLPIPFILFILNFAIYFLITPEHIRNSILFFIPMVALYLEMILLNHLVSKLRYIDSGTINFNEEQILMTNKDSTYSINWKNIHSLTINYAGDNRWKSQLNNWFQKKKGYNRYNNTHWYGFKNMDKKVLDSITINEETFYVKVKKEEDKTALFGLHEIAQNLEIKSEIRTEDLSINFFVKKLPI